MKPTPFIVVWMIIILSISAIPGKEVRGEENELDVIPLITQVPLDFSGWDRDSDGDGIDDMLRDTSDLDFEDGYMGINIHMNRPVDGYHVGSVMERADKLGMDPVFLRTGRYTTAVYLLVKEPEIGSFRNLKLPWVSFIEYRPRMETFLDVSSTAVRATASEDMSPFTAADLGFTGEGINIAVLDSGVDNKIHESLTGKYEYGVDFTGTSTLFGVDPNDVDGHGTHVAGTALGDGGTLENYVGTAPGASLLDLKIFISFGSILGNSDQAFEWILDNHEEREIDVVQCSFGSSVTTSGRDTTAQLANMLVDEGLVVVVAAGNMGTSGLPSPASADKVITVGAYDDRNTISRDDDTVEGYSNRGPRASDGDLDQMDELKPDLCAPGTDIIAPEHDSVFNYVSLTGTSMACPHISGIAALMLEANPDLSPLEIKKILRDTSQQRYNPSRPDTDEKYNFRSGWGEVDAYGAVKRAVDLQELEIDTPAEVRANEPISISARGKFTKTSFDTGSDLFSIELSTPYSWGRHDDIIAASGGVAGSSGYSGPFRVGDTWVTKMDVYYNTTVDEAEPEITVTVIPEGEEGDSGNVLATSSINEMEFAAEVRTINISEGPSPPDLSVTPLSIWFSDPVPDGGDPVDITVRVNNTGGRSVSDVVVRILDGPELSGEVIGEAAIEVPALSYGLATTTWTANPGIHAITVIVDPDDIITESNEDNNSAERPLTVRGINPPPLAQLEVDPEEGTTTTRFVFDGSSSTDTNLRGGNVVSYNFDFGDGRSSGWVDTPVIEHRYLGGGSFTASLTVKDNGGEESTNDAEVTVNVTDVSSSRDTLYLNSSMGLSTSIGPSSEIPISTTSSLVGEWNSEPLERTKVYHSLVSIQLLINSTEATDFRYTLTLSESGGISVTRSGSQDVGVGENKIAVEFETEEVEVKADEIISFRLESMFEEGSGSLLIGDQGSFIDLLYYHPFNGPPEVDAGEDVEVRVQESVDFDGSVEDPDGDITDIRWDVDEDGVYDHEGTASFTFEGYEEEGVYTVVLEARDDDGDWSQDTLKAVVRSANYNFPPDVEITCPPEISGLVTIRGTAEDDEGVEMVEVSIIRSPSNETVVPWSPAEGTEEWGFQWDSRTSPDGDYLILARAFDGSAYSDVRSCSTTVANPNSAPEIIDISVDPRSFISDQPTMILIEVEVNDPDMPSDTLSVTADLSSIDGPDDLEMADDGRGADDIEGDGVYTAGYTPSIFVEPGVYDLKFQVMDSWGEIDQATERIEVVAEVDAILTVSPGDISSGDEILLEVKIGSQLDVVITARSQLFDGTVELLDDGTGGDRIYGDSIYSASVIVEGEPGPHPLLIIIEDNEGDQLLEMDENIRISGRGSGQPDSDEPAIPAAFLTTGIIVLAFVIGSIMMVVIIRRRDNRIAVVPPMVAVAEEIEMSEGELPVQGEVPEVSQSTHETDHYPAE